MYGKGKVASCLKHHAMKMYGEEELQLHTITSTLDEEKWLALCLGCFSPWGKIPLYSLDTRLGEPQNLCRYDGKHISWPVTSLAHLLCV
jgi:hypothetical protein